MGPAEQAGGDPGDQRISAADAHQWGLVEEVVDPATRSTLRWSWRRKSRRSRRCRRHDQAEPSIACASLDISQATWTSTSSHWRA